MRVAADACCSPLLLHQACPDAILDDGLLDITYVVGDPAEGASALVSGGGVKGGGARAGIP